MGKMYRMRIDVEPKCAAEDSESRVYLSLVPIEEKSKPKKAWKKASRKIKALSWSVAKVFVSFALAFGTGIWLMQLAYQ